MQGSYIMLWFTAMGCASAQLWLPAVLAAVGFVLIVVGLLTRDHHA